MSGIVAVMGIDGESPDSGFLRRLVQSLEFRGPDRQQSWIGKGIGLGRTLLSISSESASEQQPLSLDGRTWIVADARLDGRNGVLSALRGAGDQTPAVVSDSELILRAYSTWGEACLDHFLGDFCFVIWDERRKALLCAHDQLGVKPLYYAETRRWLIVSNTLDCVRLGSEAAARLDEMAVADFLLFGENQDPAGTIFADIRRLPPAHAMTWSAGSLSVKRYWTPPSDPEVRYQHPAEYEEQFRELLQVAVKDRLRASHVGISLSGGLDSTSVAAFAARAGLNELRAVTIIYDKAMPDSERHFSGLAAESLGIPVEYLTGDPYLANVQQEFPETRSAQPEENILLPLEMDFYRLASCTSRILLTGEGGDVGLFPSNSHFRRLLKSRRLGRLLGDGARYLLAQRGLPPMGARSWLKRRFGWFDPWQQHYPEWLNPDFENRLQLRTRWQEKQAGMRPAAHPNRPEAIAVLSSTHWQNFFEVCDPGITRVCLQQVHPYFDLRLLKFLFAIPPVPWTLDKFLIRSSLRGILPESVRLRAKTPLAGDPSWIFVRNNQARFSNVPPNLTPYVDSGKYEACVRSPAAFFLHNFRFLVRVSVLSAWLGSLRQSPQLSFTVPEPLHA
jgi:asparagine synthase (glutamine-hydrolysing)